MTRFILPSALLTATLAFAPPAHAQLTRTFVSSAGSDGNPCTITQPCTSFAHAYSLTAANGTVAALDPGKYGPLTITGPITINGNGWAAITGPAGGDAITITAVSGNVTLTGLELDGAGASNNGIHLTSILSAPATLNIRDCIASNFIGSGISIQPSTSSFNNILNLLIENTSSLSNGTDGIYIITASDAQVHGTISQTTVANNGHDGFEFSQPDSVFGLDIINIYNSIATNNVSEMEVENCASVYGSEVRLFPHGVYLSGCSTGENSQFQVLHNSLISSVNMSGKAVVFSDGTNMFYSVTGGTIGKLNLQ